MRNASMEPFFYNTLSALLADSLTPVFQKTIGESCSAKLNSSSETPCRMPQKTISLTGNLIRGFPIGTRHITSQVLIHCNQSLFRTLVSRQLCQRDQQMNFSSFRPNRRGNFSELKLNIHVFRIKQRFRIFQTLH